jgi:hypothetical protein
MLFDPEHGIGLSIAAGSGRSWIDEPEGDLVHAHVQVDVEGQAVLPDWRPARWSSHVGIARWPELLRFAQDLETLATAPTGSVALNGRSGFVLTVRLRDDERIQAETAFRVGHHMEIELVARTPWNTAGGRPDLTAAAERVREAVTACRPPRPSR